MESRKEHDYLSLIRNKYNFTEYPLMFRIAYIKALEQTLLIKCYASLSSYTDHQSIKFIDLSDDIQNNQLSIPLWEQ